MQKLLITSALALSLCAGGAFAAGTAKPAAKPAAPAAAPANPKAADCAKQWKAEKKHSQTRKAFMAACEKG
jgi:hypothetical protein